jgi:hypothetical protein
MFSFSLHSKLKAYQPISPFSFNEDDLMNITCPYCYSDNVSRTTVPSKSTNTYGSMAGVGIGTMISKSLPTPMSPLLGGLLGAVVGGLIDTLTHSSPPADTARPSFHCNICQHDFQ